MMKKLILIMLLIVPTVTAEPLVFSTNQSDYYFLTGSEAVIPFRIDNLNGSVNGQMTYTLTQQMQQQGFQYSNSNTQSQTVVLSDPDFMINAGTSNDKAHMRLDMKFDYEEDGSMVYVTLPSVNIYFVEKPEDQQNQQNQQQSTSQTQEQRQEAQRQAREEQQKRLEEQMRQQEVQNQMQNRLQNHQVSQDAQNLKKQMQSQMQEQQQMREEFEKNLQSNQDFQQAKKELENQGYELQNKQMSPTANDTGTFDMQYQTPEGKTAEIRGNMENGKVQMKTIKSDELMQKLRDDHRFQKYDKQLRDEGFTQEEMNVSSNEINVAYANENNETAMIKATLKDDEIEEVELIREKKPLLWQWILLAALLIAAASFYFKKKTERPAEEEKPKEKPVDYRREAKRMVAEAQKLFDAGRKKDAYGKVSEALRLYLTHKHGDGKEINSTEAIHLLRSKKQPFKEARDCLNICSMVEFAKYKPNKKDFDEAHSIASDIVDKS